MTTSVNDHHRCQPGTGDGAQHRSSQAYGSALCRRRPPHPHRPTSAADKIVVALRACAPPNPTVPTDAAQNRLPPHKRHASCDLTTRHQAKRGRPCPAAPLSWSLTAGSLRERLRPLPTNGALVPPCLQPVERTPRERFERARYLGRQSLVSTRQIPEQDIDGGCFRGSHASHRARVGNGSDRSPFNPRSIANDSQHRSTSIRSTPVVHKGNPQQSTSAKTRVRNQRVRGSSP